MDFKLRKWELEDACKIVKYANNPNVAKNLTDQFPSPYTEEDGVEYIMSIIGDDPVKVFAIDVNGEAVGSIGIFPQTDIHRRNAEMGYWLAEEYWGQGIMPEAIKGMIDYGFKTFDIDRIFARPFGINKRSQRVLEKSGFILEARFDKVLIKQGELLDELIYAIRRPQTK